ncbi:MAG: AI-2E family transporter [Flavobacteriaceae bacterium]|nr:AI-2E family transporter [Flavobacteriaceae bacterium]
MSTSRSTLLYTGAALIAFLVLTVYGLVYAKSFLAPLTVALILTLLLIPVTRKLERWNLNKNLAALVSTIVLLLVSVGFFLLVIVQMNNVVDKWETIKDTMQPKIESATNFLIDNTPVTEEKIKGFKTKFRTFEIIGSSKNRGSAFTYLTKIVGFFGTYLLVFIYVFFLLRFRSKFKKFILKFFKENKKQEVKETLQEISSVAQGYLLGKLKLIGLLAIVYSIGLGISGVSNFILVALIASILTIIPYLGNVLGYCLAIIFGYLINGEIGVLIGITLTFIIAQFVESYILQPYIVGDEVDLNPFFVILVVILGNLLWGIVGMVVAIPVLGIFNVIFLHVPSLKPFGFLFQKSKKD